MLGRALVLSLVCAGPVPAARVQPEGPGRPPGAGPVAVIPDPAPPAVPEHVWQTQLRRLRVQTAVSWTLAAVGITGLIVPIALVSRCDEDARFRECPEGRGALIAMPIFGALALASLVPAVIFTDRLVYHRRPERRVRMAVSPNGIELRF